MRSNDYWADRANARMDEYMDKAVVTTAELELAYIAISIYLAEHARRVFTNFSIGISETDARRLLNTIDSNNITEQVKWLFNQTKDPQLRQELVKQLESPAYRARLLRLENLSKQVESLTHLVGEKEQALAKHSYLNTATHAYYRTAFDITQGVGNMIEFAATDRISEIVATNWSGKHYSNRIWRNADMLANRLKSEFVVGFATGKSSGKMARVIADEFNTAFVNAARLLRTETNFVANQAEIESYKVLGVKWYKFLATLDSRTSKLCKQQDGKIYSVDKAVAGTNLPPMHANCRSTTVSVLDTVGETGIRFAKDKRGKPVRVSSDMTYAQWYGKYGDIVGERKIMNESSDFRQYEKYKKLLDKKATKTFAKFQNLKYNEDTESWSKMKRNYRIFNKINNTEAYSFEYKSKLKETYTYFADEGFEFTEHALGRALGQKTGKDKRSFENVEVLTVLKQPPNFTQEDGKLVRFYNKLAIIQATDTKEIVSIVVKNKARSDWKEIK